MADVTCPESRDLFSARADDALAADERAVLDAHLAACADCAREWRRFEATLGLLRAVEPPRAPAGLVDRVLAARPRPWYRRLARGLLVPWSVKLPLQAAAVVLVGGLAVMVFQRSPDLQQAARAPDAAVSALSPEVDTRAAELQAARAPERAPGDFRDAFAPPASAPAAPPAPAASAPAPPAPAASAPAPPAPAPPAPVSVPPAPVSVPPAPGVARESQDRARPPAPAPGAVAGIQGKQTTAAKEARDESVATGDPVRPRYSGADVDMPPPNVHKASPVEPTTPPTAAAPAGPETKREAGGEPRELQAPAASRRPSEDATPAPGQKPARAGELALRRDARAAAIGHVEARLRAPDRPAAEREIRALAARLDGAVTPGADSVEVVVTRARWDELERALARIGAFRIERRPAELPAVVRLTIRLD